MVVERWVGERIHGFWDTLTGSLDWDVIVLLEVDAGLLLCWVVGNAEELTLDTCVCWPWDVLAVDPSAVA